MKSTSKMFKALFGSAILVSLVALLVAVLSVAALAQTVSFSPATHYALGTGWNQYSVAVGDLNGDGKPDLAVASYCCPGSISILLGTGTGAFGPPTHIAMAHPYYVAIGDLNGDGKSDLAVANYSSNDVSILLGTGTGSFGPAANFATGARPWSVTIGDLSGDGKPDLAVGNGDSNDVSILLGDGTGFFGPATNFAVGANPRVVAIGDLSGDGKPDLAVANTGSNNVSILLGDGTGSFGPATNFAVGSVSPSVAIGDLNDDGKPDLATANVSSSNVSILLGDGTGSFGAATNFAAGVAPHSVAIGDLNGDSKLDLAVANGIGDNVSILLGDGTGSFGAATNFAVGPLPYHVVIRDLNGDGKPDLAVANASHYACCSRGVSVLLNTTNWPPVANAGASQIVEATSAAGASVTLDGSASSDPDGDTLTYTWTGPFGTASGVSPTVTVPLGTNTITLSVDDGHGLTASATTNVTVHDTTPPVLSGTPADMVLEATNSVGAVASWASPTAADIVDGATLVSCAPSSGSTFAIGTEQVSCFATDAHSNTATVHFNVTVRDTTRPTIDAHGDVTVTATSPAGAIVNYTSPATHDLVDGAGVASCAPASGSQFALGNTTVNCSATDAHGNPATPTSFMVHVVYLVGGSCVGAPSHQILQPVNADGSSVFKKGSVVPTKFRVCDVNGNSIGTPGVVTALVQVASVGGTVSEVDELGYSNTPDSSFRWDPAAQQWIFNLGTKNNSTLAAGSTVVFRIYLNDGTFIQYQFGLK